ncbi:hypothetical protein [Mycobacterium asiaticum]|nr:hypothetical protein [Mycobacterium asiaticum]
MLVPDESRIDGGRRAAARGTETFVIPADGPTGRAEIHHIDARFKPFIQH